MKPEQAAALKSLMDMSNKAIKMRVLKTKAPGMPEESVAEVETEPNEMGETSPEMNEADVQAVLQLLQSMGGKEDDEENC